MFDKTKYLEYEKFFLSSDGDPFSIFHGHGSVMLSAPHCVKHERNGKLLYAEPQSGAIARLLHDELNCPLICKTGNIHSDPNFDIPSPYKDALIEYVHSNNIRYVLDLHQLSPRHATQVEIGTGLHKNILSPRHLNIAIDAFLRQGIIVDVDKRFKASRHYTLSSYIASHCNISCLQIEINSNLLHVEHEQCAAHKIFDALKDMITTFRKEK